MNYIFVFWESQNESLKKKIHGLKFDSKRALYVPYIVWQTINRMIIKINSSVFPSAKYFYRLL